MSFLAWDPSFTVDCLALFRKRGWVQIIDRRGVEEVTDALRKAGLSFAIEAQADGWTSIIGPGWVAPAPLVSRSKYTAAEYDAYTTTCGQATKEGGR